MIMQNSMVFELKPEQIKLKKLLNKEFLELEMYIISDVDPNRNNFHFTVESMQKVLAKGLQNKPIVGCFDRGDFVSHEGRDAIDTELDNDYWDTNYAHGERILGWVRESDTAQLVQKDGQNWIKINCAICVAYAYQQTKKLLKDKNKKVSVEITLLEVGERDDGVIDIIDFDLKGVTILGSRNGVPVVEGVQGAHLSVLDRIETEVFSEQKKVLTFAYNKMDEGQDLHSEGKEEDMMEETSTKTEVFEDAVVNEPEKELEMNDCGEQKCEEESKCETEACDDQKCAEAATEEAHVEEATVEEATCESKCGDPDCTTCEDHTEEPESCEDEKECDCTEKCEEAAADCDPDAKCEDCGKEEEPSEEPHCEACDKPNCEACDKAQKCETYEAKIAEFEATIAELNNKLESVNAEFAEACTKLERCSDYDVIFARMTEAEKFVHESQVKAMKEFAMSAMSNENIDEEMKNNIVAKCERSEYASEQNVLDDIAIAIYRSRKSAPETFSAPIVTSTIVEENNSKPMTRAERIKARNENR